MARRTAGDRLTVGANHQEHRLRVHAILLAQAVRRPPGIALHQFGVERLHQGLRLSGASGNLEGLLLHRRAPQLPGVRGGRLEDRRAVVRGGGAGRDAQVRPRLAAHRLGQVEELSHVIDRVTDRAHERLLDAERLAADRDGGVEIVVGQRADGREQISPTGLPPFQQLRPRHRAHQELVVAIAPRLFAV